MGHVYTASSSRTTFNGTAEINQVDESDMPEHTNFRFNTIAIEGDRAFVRGSSANKKTEDWRAGRNQSKQLVSAGAVFHPFIPLIDTNNIIELISI